MGKTAFLFSGQGAQKQGMGRELFSCSKAARDVFETADQALEGRVTKLCFEGSQEELNDTRNTQPALLAVDLAAVAAFGEALQVQPAYLSGFSLGEFAALAFGGVIGLGDVFSLVQKRALLMSECAPAGSGMAAVLSLDAAVVEEICRETGAQSVNYNCPGQTVVAGLKDQLEATVQAVAERGGKAVMLPVSGAFHSSCMEPASALFAQELQQYVLHDATIPIVSNTTGEGVTAAQSWQELMPRQMRSPVRWEQSIRAMIADGADTFVEFGPGGTLCGFLRRIDRSARSFRVEDEATLRAAISALKGV